LLFATSEWKDRAIAGILGAMWLWTGIAYQGVWFSEINKAAYLFAAMFVVQGGALLYAGLFHRQLVFGVRQTLAATAGGVLILYSAIVYPLLSLVTGHPYPEMPMFGVTPCPVTLFSFGFFLLTMRRVPGWLLVVPFAWSLVGGSAAVLLRMPQDWPLLVSGLVAVPLVAHQNRRTFDVARS
jgi:hypothetical protein